MKTVFEIRIKVEVIYEHINEETLAEIGEELDAIGEFTVVQVEGIDHKNIIIKAEVIE